MAKSKSGMKKLPRQTKVEASSIRLKSEELVLAAQELSSELRDKRSLDLSAILVVLRPIKSKGRQTKAGKALDIGEISCKIMEDVSGLKRDLSDLERYLDSHPGMDPYAVKGKKAYVFPYGLPVKTKRH